MNHYTITFRTDTGHYGTHTLQASSISEAEIAGRQRGLGSSGPIICIWQSDRMGKPRTSGVVGIEFVDVIGRDFQGV